jgi:hypothetical protein
MTDPRARLLAQRRQNTAHESGSGLNPGWDQLAPQDQKILLGEAEEWLRAAVEAGLMPLAERPSDGHSAVWLDEYGDLWAEYPTSPPSYGDAILPLVWASEVCSSKEEMEARGITFRLIGWSE